MTQWKRLFFPLLPKHAGSAAKPGSFLVNAKPMLHNSLKQETKRIPRTHNVGRFVCMLSVWGEPNNLLQGYTPRRASPLPEKKALLMKQHPTVSSWGQDSAVQCKISTITLSWCPLKIPPPNWFCPDFLPDWQTQDFTSVSDLVPSAGCKLEYLFN